MYAEAYLQRSRFSSVELFWKSHKKNLLQMFSLILNTPLVVEKVSRMSILVLYSQSQKYVIDLLVSWINKRQEGVICFQVFCCCYKLSNKNTKPNASNRLMLHCKLWTILVHCYNGFIAYSVFHLTFFTFSYSEKNT